MINIGINGDTGFLGLYLINSLTEREKYNIYALLRKPINSNKDGVKDLCNEVKAKIYAK